MGIGGVGCLNTVPRSSLDSNCGKKKLLFMLVFVLIKSKGNGSNLVTQLPKHPDSISTSCTAGVRFVVSVNSALAPEDPLSLWMWMQSEPNISAIWMSSCVLKRSYMVHKWHKWQELVRHQFLSTINHCGNFWKCCSINIDVNPKTS